MMTTTKISLQKLPVGSNAVVVEIDPQCQECERMATMGLTVGSLVKMAKKGTPCLITIGRSRLALRSDSLKNILVTPITP